ncbi:MAG: ABC transporter ATP-binding protein [Chloroflexota bacterium]|nr:ABC transporter ATP-binding protein [Chloroflexota bacterium]NOG64115.1 ABC transporter ATP-binding protein [Chloroflexota bacterium]GIK65831.1 MAG: ABC transporter ATP-binding protein [Chloroflexota bacterium]
MGNHRNNSSRAPATDVVRLKQVSKTYETSAGSFDALKSIDLNIQSGEFVAVVGKSGSGKSTLLNVITGIDRITSGEVWVNNTALHTLSENQLAIWRGRTIGIVFQFFQLLPTLTVIENVMLPMDFGGHLTGKQRKARALELLNIVGIESQAYKLPNALSGGQQQRAAIARALANDPPIIVADEPTGNLDSHTSEVILELFASLIQEGKTILMVTHEPGIAQYTNRTITLADGAILSDMMPERGGYAQPTLA